MWSKKYTLESFKEKLYEKHPNTTLIVLENYKYGKILVENKFGKCIDSKMNILRYGKVSIETAVDKTEYFINQAREIHGNRFDYTNVKYAGCDKKIKIVCSIHGEFEQTPYKHLTYKGCTQCSRLQRSKETTSTTNQFIEKANKIHNFEYDYSEVEYKKAKQKVKIICKQHGEFEQIPNNHLSGQGCPKCKLIKIGNAKRGYQKDYIEKFKEVHGDKYGYSLVNYTHFEKKVKLICNTHGVFEQTPSCHLRGSGCRKCSNLKMSELQGKLNNGWNYHLWEKKGNNSKNFDGFKVYIIKCYNETEEFYKIGKTFNKLKRRFSCKTLLPYNYDVIKIIKGEAKEISQLERELHKMHKQDYYTPQIHFEGNKECFSKLEMEQIELIIKNLISQ